MMVRYFVPKAKITDSIIAMIIAEVKWAVTHDRKPRFVFLPEGMYCWDSSLTG